jgi:hypothetical protein
MHDVEHGKDRIWRRRQSRSLRGDLNFRKHAVQLAQRALVFLPEPQLLIRDVLRRGAVLGPAGAGAALALGLGLDGLVCRGHGRVDVVNECVDGGSLAGAYGDGVGGGSCGLDIFEGPGRVVWLGLACGGGRCEPRVDLKA